MAKRKLKKGSAVKDINAKEYRNLYNTGDLMSVDTEGYPTMYSSDVQVVGEAPEWLRLQRQKQAAQWSDEELERYMYSGKKPKRDVGYNLLPEERLKIYNSVVPLSYPKDEIKPALNRYMTGKKRPYGAKGQEITEVDEDAWAQYMGVPQLYNTVEKSKYKPTSSKKGGEDYYTIRKGYEDFDDMLLWDAENAFSRPNTKDYYVETSDDGKTKRGFNSSFLPLENVTISKGTDDRGDYYSIYDTYDFDIPMQEKIGKPYEVYDRVYYKDYGSGNKVMRYTDSELLNEKVNEDNYKNIAKELENRNYLIRGFEEPTLETITQSLNAFQKNKKANGGVINPIEPEDKEAAMRGMMKARMALDSHFGNPSAKRMTSLSPQEYTFTGNEYDYDWNQPIGVPAGETGTHFMTSMGNYAVPFIQQATNGLYFNERPSSKDKEAIKFETPEEAQYFSENYKNIAPMMYNKKVNGGIITNNMKKKKLKMAKGGVLKPNPVDPPLTYSWSNSSTSTPVPIAKIRTSESSAISKTTPSNVLSTYIYEGLPISEEAIVKPDYSNLELNPIDKYTNSYKNKPLGKRAFPQKDNNETMIDDGYMHNNAWMSSNINLLGLKQKGNRTGIAGHLNDIMSDEEMLAYNPTLYLIKKNLSLPNQKQYDSKLSIGEGNDEINYINKNILPKGYTYQDLGNGLIRNFTPENDTLLGSVTLTPNMWKQVYDSQTEEEAKRKLFKMANVSPEEEKNFENTFIHMNLNNPKQFDSYQKVKSKLPNTNWDDKKALGGTINMKKKKTKNLPLDNNLPKAYLGAILGGLPTDAASGLGAATGAASLSRAAGAGGGLSSLSNMNNSSLSTAGGPLAGVMKMLNGPLAPLMGMTMNAVTDMADAIINPERERRPVLQNAASYTFGTGGTINTNCPPGYIKNAKGECVFDTQYAINQMYENDKKPDKEYDVNAIKNKIPFNHSLEWNIAEAIDPTGITSWPDVYETWTDSKFDYNDIIEPLGALPALGRLGKITKAFKGKAPKTIYNKWYDGLGLFGNTIDSSQDIYNDNINPTKKAMGGTIKIKPSKKGTFTAAAKKHGKGVQAFAKQVLANKDNYSSAMVKKANFAKNAAKWKKAMGGLVDSSYMDAFDAMGYGGNVFDNPEYSDYMAMGGVIDPSMYMQQMMYGSYAQGGQIPQNIPVEVEGEEMYEMPNGEMGEFQGPKHENGGMPMALPEGTKIYSDRLKVNGKTMADRKEKRENNIKKLEKLLNKNPNDKFIKESLKRQQETAALEEQSDMAMQEQANQQQAQEEMAMEEMLMGAAQQDMQEGMMMAMGGMIKRADGSYSQRGLWDNIRANRGSGKKPTKEMLKQEKKIKMAEKALGGILGNDSYAISMPTYANGTPPDGTPPFLTEEQLNQFTNFNTNPLDLRENVGVNITSFPKIKEPVTAQLPTYPLAMGVDPIADQLQQLMMNGLPDQMAGKYPLNPKKPNRFMNFLNNAVDKTGDFFSGLFDRNGNPKRSTTGNEYDLTEGDRVGMAGTSVGMYGPAAMTMLNRLETPKNINFFSTFGQDALRTQEEAEGLAGISKDEAYRKNLMRANALRKQLANSARGVGDIRSGQLTAELAEQEGARGILGNYLQGMAGLKGQRAQLQQQIDQTRMGGEYQRDLADRQDIDQYYTNLAENVANASNMMQKQGRDLNVVQYNKDIMALSKAYSKYGVYAVRDPRTGLLNLAQKDANGKIVYLSEDEVKELPKKNQTTQQPQTTEVKEDK